MIQEAGTYTNEWEHEVHAEKVSIYQFFAAMGHTSTPNASEVNVCPPSEEV